MITVKNTEASRAVKSAADNLAVENMFFSEEFLREMLDMAAGEIDMKEEIEKIKQNHKKEG